MGVWWGCGGCEPRIKVILKVQKSRGWGGGQVVDVNQELKLFENEKKSCGGGGEGVRWM